MQHGRAHHLQLDQVVDRLGPPGERAHPFRHRSPRDLNAKTAEHRRLAIERHAIAILGDRDVGDQAWARHALGDHQIRRRRLDDLLAAPASVFRAHIADHFVLDRDLLEHFGDVLADFDPSAGATAIARRFRLQDDDVAGQMGWRRLAQPRLARGSRSAGPLGLGLSVSLALALGLLKVFQLELKLLGDARQLLRGGAVMLASHLHDQRFEMLDLDSASFQRRLRRKRVRARRIAFGIALLECHVPIRDRRTRFAQRRFQRIDVIREISGIGHEA